jgi:CRISPR-associated protein Cmr1
VIKSGSENCSWVGGVQFELETVTPLFLGGADPRGEPELRAASIRGALRFWLRALLGGFTGSSPHGLDQLRQAESKVFGSTATGASSVIVRIVQEQTSKTSFSKIVGELPGVAYLFFATRKIGNEPERIAINPETKFRLILSPRPVVKKGHLLLWHACAALWLLVHV